MTTRIERLSESDSGSNVLNLNPPFLNVNPPPNSSTSPLSSNLESKISLFDGCDCVIFDFDSTIINGESLEFILEDVLSEAGGDKERKMKEIDKTTKLAMNGEMSFKESLERRLELCKRNKRHIDRFVEKHCPGLISTGMEELIQELHRRNKKVFILSGGFTDCIVPFAEYLNIPKNNVYAVEINWDESRNDDGSPTETNGNFLSLKTENQFAEGKTEGGMAITRRSFVDRKYTIVIGDGFSDYKLYEEGIAQEFFAYIEHAERAKVVELAPKVVENVEKLTQYFK